MIDLSREKFDLPALALIKPASFYGTGPLYARA